MSGFQSLARMVGRLRGSPPGQPQLSLVLIVYDMPEQAANTIRSLLPGYQRDVSGSEYELIVVENASSNTLSAGFLQDLPANVHYHLRQNPEPSPAQAINFGASQAQGGAVCVMIDGARMVTPGVVCNLLAAHRSFPRAVVSIPGYHLGRELQQTAVGSGYDRDTERDLLASIAWPEDGYRLFDVACFSGSCRPGFFLPNSESNCISIPLDVWHTLSGFNTLFDLPGGGLINLDFYKRACELPEVQHVIVPGEGTFHQFHGGVTTGGVSREMREDYIERSRNQYRALRGADFSSPRTSPVYLGAIPAQAQKFVHYSAARALRSLGEAPLPDSTA
ncbi:glycosyltransferase [Haliea sp. E1-2-M8]|uniref:glycosyltransferase family 2 protein n=1 Tax=Haliea sp. E1-2-M8 TaxID=3064706 RepID=UPI00271C206B|nr:glycosyltransferase [Haliea sp. E1-2-M8]MDO8862507.1 glycosyltransferase [Haliea sp. E1-2-M8]